MSDQHPIPTSPGGRAPAGGADALERLDGVVAELRALAQVDWAAIATQHSTDLVRRLEQIQRTTTAIQADVLAAAESSGMWALDGQRNFDTWLSHTTGTSRGTAGKAARLSKSLTDDLPRTRKALAEGAISSDHARIISQRCAKTPKQRAKLSDPRQGEGYLVEQAKLMDATKFSRFAKTWAIESDPRAADRQWRKESAKEELSFTSSGDGYYISGFFNQVHGAL